jgi:hypothetical protein
MTTHRFTWENGHQILKTLSRSFDTLEKAQEFAKNKNCTDIYMTHGRYKVEWIKVVSVEGETA